MCVFLTLLVCFVMLDDGGRNEVKRRTNLSFMLTVSHRKFSMSCHHANVRTHTS